MSLLHALFDRSEANEKLSGSPSEKLLLDGQESGAKLILDGQESGAKLIATDTSLSLSPLGSFEAMS